MKIDTKGRTAIAAMLDIAVHGTDSPVRLADIGKRQHISLSYLEQLFRKLRENGFVASYRGPGGGYRLNRRLGTISVAEIIGAVDSEAFAPDQSACADHASGTPRSATDTLWARVDDHLRDYLRSLTLESVLADARDAGDLAETAAAAPTMPSRTDADPPPHEIRPAAAMAEVGAPA
jgi:Rrf2 family iron-sulfur cluster assembly transcriptional regulator